MSLPEITYGKITYVIGPQPLKFEYWVGPLEVFYGVYQCGMCGKEYTVNDGTWRLCTPEVCHDCYES